MRASDARRSRLLFVAGLCAVAAAAALFASGFRSSLSWVYRALYHQQNIVDSIAGLPPWWRLAVPVIGATIAGTIARLRAARAQGVSNVMEAVALGHVRLSLRATGSRVAASWFAIASGMSIGREGPLIEAGGALGSTMSRQLGASLTDTRLLIAAGTAAGFASAYNTPFAAALFVLETIAGVAAPALLLPVLTAVVIATAVTRAIVGAGPIYGQREFRLDSPLDLALYAALGVAAALAAVVFKHVLAAFERWFEVHPLPQPARAIAGGALVGAIAVWVPAVAGNGYEPLNRLLDTPAAVGAVALLAAAKVLATSGSVACGIPGGVFTPMLLVGAALGSAWSQLAARLAGAPGHAGSYALVGMAAATAASIHAPLTAAVMIFELSGDYPIVLPLIVATVVATVTSRALRSESVYQSELRKRGLAWDITLEGREMR